MKPHVFAGPEMSGSDVWGREVCFERGKVYLIAAGSGKGKSSLFDFMYGRRGDYAGEILFDGKNAGTLNPDRKKELRRSHLGIVFQGFRMFPELTAMENVTIKNRLTNYKTKRQIEEMFEQLDLSAKINASVALLSFGQKQRVAIIRALCQPLDFLLLDEPFSHLDEANYTVACRLIAGEVKKQQAALLLTSLGEPYTFDYTRKMCL
ncbi:MAG: ATP-binding cassette domain-containing protein [Prevotellaceae bacterium]|nr:ATP-binding cassette domain-containing protein [Prevotellaceae bacterium]